MHNECLILILLNTCYTNYQFCFYNAYLKVLNDTAKSISISVCGLWETTISSNLKQLYYQFEKEYYVPLSFDQYFARDMFQSLRFIDHISRVEPGHLVPYLTQPSKPLVSPKRANKESCKRQKVKIVLTRDQLELLLRGAKKLHPPGDIAVQMLKSFGFEEASPIWRPSLATIPEVHGF
ncbi:hypothetical protein FEM48_Zijuj09G0153100 [Ziziphus jujuba var. spinosa]|uniref:Uncharacterized protein n=1 Tax=Ziziphus jujuba var. spinosa TaxID=714518 RepID=A0A978UTR4_ZIZJJ|nr:hypothetical protein FEM48_Zijuj09G0153100 [Ziziphus jujuba var. spinosa]